MGLGCCVHAQQPKFVMEGRAQGTTYHILYYHPYAAVIQKDIDSVLNVIDLSMSLYRKESLISHFNTQSEDCVEMDPHMANVVRKSLAIYQKSKGVFDVTVKPLVQLWGFGPEHINQYPHKQEIDSVLQFVGMDKLMLRGKKLCRKSKNVSIDLNGIAQGYTVDVLADFLSSKRVTNFLVELGGEIRTKGTKADRTPFQVGIERPDTENRSLVLELKNLAVTTSGNYQKSFDMEGKKIHHHINPQTGYPVQNNIASVTVIAKTAMDADAYDNVFMALSVEKGLQLANSTKNIEVYIIYKENDLFKEAFSKGFSQYIKN